MFFLAHYHSSYVLPTVFTGTSRLCRQDDDAILKNKHGGKFREFLDKMEKFSITYPKYFCKSM